MIDSVMVANRGEIACRVFRTCAAQHIETVAVYSDADEHALHVAMADRSVRIGPARPAESYLDASRIIDAALQESVDAIHPGYGFLSESAQFARDVIDAGIVWIGPPPDAIMQMGDKINARATITAAGVPAVPGSEGPITSPEAAVQAADLIGYPVILKASGGGGGIGMTVADGPDALNGAYASAGLQAERFFGNPDVYLEKYIASARHIEVQVMGFNDGSVTAVGDRDCSVQRRHQKVLEEAPAPGLSDVERAELHRMACEVARAVNYRGAGTVEMILDRSSRRMYFLEMNTRLQVEHPVTEMVTGIDLVSAQIQIAGGQDPWFHTPVPASGHAIELRVCAEDPDRFLPSPGRITSWDEPDSPGLRIDSGYRSGDEVTPYYDSLMAKLCAWGTTRNEAMDRLADAADRFSIQGPKSTLDLARRLTSNTSFRENTHDTSLLSESIR